MSRLGGWGESLRARSPLMRVEEHSLLGLAYGADTLAGRSESALGTVSSLFAPLDLRPLWICLLFCILAGGLRRGLVR